MVFDIEQIHTGSASVYVRLPVFRESEGKTVRRETQNIQRMNTFYQRLAGYITEFTATEDFPPGGRYCAESSCLVSDDGTNITVTVKLTLFCRGRRTAERRLVHTWSDGIIVADDEEQPHSK